MTQRDDYIPPIPAKLQAILQQISNDVVDGLGCLGALVATLEQDHLLAIRAHATRLPADVLAQLGLQDSLKDIWPRGLLDLNNNKHKDNLCYRALKANDSHPPPYLLSDTIYDLFRPLINRQLAEKIQQQAGIRQVAAIPFFIEDETVGILLVITTQQWTERDLQFLVAYGNQAAIAVQGQQQMVAMAALERIILRLQSRITDETEVLQIIAEAVVEELGFVGAMVATLEAGNALPVRAFRIEAPLANVIQQLEDRAGISLLGPKAQVFLDDDTYQENLSVRAIRGDNGRPMKYLVSDRLYDLLRPFVSRPFARLAQQLIGIKHVIAIPFFLEDEVVGNLFAATRRERFTPREIELITVFGQQAAVGLRNARLYHIAEERRHIAQQFGRMAFNATVSLHALRNYAGSMQVYLELLQMLHKVPPEKHAEILAKVPTMLTYLHKMSHLLDTLHQPWQKIIEEPIDVNHCLHRAFRSFFPELIPCGDDCQLTTETGIIIHWCLTADLPLIYAAQDMLTEAFRILIKNALDARDESKAEMHLHLATAIQDGRLIRVTVSDNGTGIPAEHLDRIFEMGWSSKESRGMGFGLYWTQDYLHGLGGQITVESKVGQGTTFKIYLPTST